MVGCQNSKITNSEDNTLEEKEEKKKEQIFQSAEQGEQMKEQFFQAVEKGQVIEIENLINEGIDINVVDDKGRTAAMIATYANHQEIVKVLIKRGADIDIQDDMENNPFLYAGAEGYLEILKLTIEAEANPKLLNRYGGTALIPASEHGYVEVVKELLENTDIDVNHVNNLGWTALMEAIVLSDGGKGQQETIKLLIEYGADVNILDSKGVTPLQHAKSRGFTKIIEILLSAGAK